MPPRAAPKSRVFGPPARLDRSLRSGLRSRDALRKRGVPGAVLGGEAGSVALPRGLARLRGADHGLHLVVHRVRDSFRDALAEGVRGTALALRRVAAVELVERFSAMAGREVRVGLLLLAGRRRVRDSGACATQGRTDALPEGVRLRVVGRVRLGEGRGAQVLQRQLARLVRG